MAFKRIEGLEGGVPQQFADFRIPKCPMCGTNKPHWSMDQRMGNMLSADPEEKANKYLYKCEKCECILRVLDTDVVGVTEKMHSKETGTIYVTVEEIGKAQTAQLFKELFTETEMSLEFLQVLAEQY